MIEVVIILVLLIVAIWQRWNYVRVRRLMAAGWRAEQCYGIAGGGWKYNSPDEPNTIHNRRSLAKAYRRYALIKAHEDLNVPMEKAPAYELGGFTDEGDQK